MKRFSFVFASLLMLISLKTNAQNQRILLLESFTNTGCGPCAMYNPAMDALIANNLDKLVAIKYHVNWPLATDPMYLHNTTDNGARTSYYGVNSVPHVVVDGNRFSGNSGNITQSIINQLTVIESPMEMRLSWELNADRTVVTVHVMGRASTAVQGNLKVYVGVIEKEIHFNSAPGNNGEKDFYQVMKKLLPNQQGQSIGEMAAGDYFAYSYSWQVANFYDLDQIDAIAWVQNGNNKEVIQACASSQNMVPFYANEAGVSNLSNVKSMNCSGFSQPVVELSNFGSAPLTSAELDVVVNGEMLKTVAWSGNLATYASEMVELGEVGFPVENTNTMEVRIKSVNGGSDEAPSNDVVTKTFKGAPETVGKVLRLTIRTDNNPQETTWALTNISTGAVVLQGGPYEQANNNYTETLEIVGDGCYDLTIYDAGGDGLVGGFYGLKAGSTTLFSGGEFADFDSNEFSYEVSADVEESLDQATMVYPNPTTGLVNIVCDGNQNVAVYNMIGQCVFEGVADGWLQIDMKAYGTGVYAVKVGSDTQRVVVK